jgi:hypothetical protein
LPARLSIRSAQDKTAAFVSAVVVDDGTEAVAQAKPGVGALRVEPAFDTGPTAGTVGADGHMDFFERGLLKVVTTGQVLARILAVEVGAGLTRELRLGAGVVMDDGGEVTARHGGVVLYKPGEALDVVADHVHQGAVDLRTGHLDMQGSLTVKGDVERLLQARASGDLEVLGSVSGGSLRAGGSIRVSANVRGGDGARVIAEHDVTLKSCENAEVAAGGTLRVQEAVNSQLHGQHVVVARRMRGGACVAERSLVVKEAGTPSGIATLLQAGEPLELPDLAEVQRAVVLQKLRRMAERGGVRDAFGSRGEARGKGGKLGRLNAALSAEQLAARAEHAQHRTQLERAAIVEVGIVHPGVEVRIGPAHVTFDQVVRGLRYALDPETAQLRAARSVE